MVDGVCQEEVVVTDLERKISAAAFLQEGKVPAILPPTITGLRNTDTLPVIIAEMVRSVHVQLFSEKEQGSASLPVFLAQIKLAQPSF